MAKSNVSTVQISNDRGSFNAESNSALGGMPAVRLINDGDTFTRLTQELTRELLYDDVTIPDAVSRFHDEATRSYCWAVVSTSCA